jgi:hypothetical protein
MSDEKVYYGIADCFLIDNATRKSNIITNNKLISFESSSMEILMDKMKISCKDKIKKDMNYYNQHNSMFSDHGFSISEHIKLNFPSSYIIRYTKQNNSIIILDKTKFDNETLNKYLILM